MRDADPPPEVVAGQVVGGKWRIVAPLGRGGMGAVYEGQNIAIGKKVALKFIDAEFARHPDIAESLSARGGGREPRRERAHRPRSSIRERPTTASRTS